MNATHPECSRPYGHTCQQPSGRECIETGCTERAGTLWGPHWCPEHDAERIERIAEGMRSIEEGFR